MAAAVILAATAYMATNHGLFDHILQVVPIHTSTWHIVPWAHTSQHPKWHLDLFSHFAGLTVIRNEQTDRHRPCIPCTDICSNSIHLSTQCTWCRQKNVQAYHIHDFRVNQRKVCFVKYPCKCLGMCSVPSVLVSTITLPNTPFRQFDLIISCLSFPISLLPYAVLFEKFQFDG